MQLHVVSACTQQSSAVLCPFLQRELYINAGTQPTEVVFVPALLHTELVSARSKLLEHPVQQYLEHLLG